MSNQIPSQEIQQTFEDYTIQGDSSYSPRTTHRDAKLFFSPFHVAEFTQVHKPDTSSPEFEYEFTNSFKRIMENDNEESSESSEVFDIMGHKINEFNAPTELEDIPESQFFSENEDKENQHPPYYTKTPLKIERKEIRSPLEDITPSMTHKKMKTSSKLSISAKRNYLTPRTMQKSRLASSGLRKIQRF